MLAAAVIGLGLAISFAPRRAAVPLALLVSGIFTFALIGAAGASVIERYLAVAAVALLVFAGVALAGFTMVRRGRLRTAWMALSAALVVFGVVFTATHVRLDTFNSELTFRGDAHRDLVRVLESPQVQKALKCGPLSEPNHKLVPDSRWILDLPANRVIPRAEPGAPKPRKGVAHRRHEPVRDLQARVEQRRRLAADPAAAARAGSGSSRAISTRRMRSAERFALPLILLVALGLRLWGIHHGLPYVYNPDENAHFVPRAIGMFGHSLDPQYFVNPPAFTYLLHLAFWVRWGSRTAVGDAFAADPSTAFTIARVLTALLGAASVGLLAWAGARLVDRRVGLVAAALLAVAFLPVHYAHQAVNDVPALAPLCLSLVGIAGVYRDGRLRDYALAGAALGVACATKYTAGIVLLACSALAASSPGLGFRRNPRLAARTPALRGRACRGARRGS